MNSKIPNNWRRFESLVEIVAHLRGPDGCPWDKEQTHLSLAPYAIEEVFEFVEALEKKDNDPTEFNLKEELGDVLFQIILHCQLAKERNAFDIHDVIEIINQKMVRRHPHVFADTKADNADEVIRNWEQIKKQEKEKKQATPLEHFDLPNGLPALQKSFKIGKKTEKFQFDWSNASEVFLKVEEELTELKEAVSNESLERQEEEMGDLLFAISQLSRHLKIEPESALRKANLKFESRFFAMLNLAKSKDLNFDKLSTKEKEKLWQEIKTIQKN
jgi:tetrapyrrole methylase family protein/MazG family protein